MISNDPLVRYQWYLDNFGQTGGPRDIDLDIQEAWRQTKVQGVVIGFPRWHPVYLGGAPRS